MGGISKMSSDRAVFEIPAFIFVMVPTYIKKKKNATSYKNNQTTGVSAWLNLGIIQYR